MHFGHLGVNGRDAASFDVLSAEKQAADQAILNERPDRLRIAIGDDEMRTESPRVGIIGKRQDLLFVPEKSVLLPNRDGQRAQPEHGQRGIAKAPRPPPAAEEKHRQHEGCAPQQQRRPWSPGQEQGVAQHQGGSQCKYSAYPQSGVC